MILCVENYRVEYGESEHGDLRHWNCDSEREAMRVYEYMKGTHKVVIVYNNNDNIIQRYNEYEDGTEENGVWTRGPKYYQEAYKEYRNIAKIAFENGDMIKAMMFSNAADNAKTLLLTNAYEDMQKNFEEYKKRIGVI